METLSLILDNVSIPPKGVLLALIFICVFFWRLRTADLKEASSRYARLSLRIDKIQEESTQWHMKVLEQFATKSDLLQTEERIVENMRSMLERPRR